MTLAFLLREFCVPFACVSCVWWVGVDTSKSNSNEEILTLQNGLIQAKIMILRSMGSDAIVWKIKYRDKNFMIFGLDAIKEGFEFRNKNFSVWIWMP